MIGPLRGRSAAELGTRLRQVLAARLERAGVASGARLPSERAFLARLEPRVSSPQELLERFRRGDPGRVFPALADPSAVAGVAARRWPDRFAALTERVEGMHHGRFPLLGYEALDFGVPVDWHLDPVSGKRSPRRHWSRLDPLDAAVVGDHKVVWELNRHQHFHALARAWLGTGEDRHVRLLLAMLRGWMAENEPGRGINWASSLELAYRSIAWIWTLNLVRHSELLDAGTLLRALEHLWLHGRHIDAHLSTYYSPNTHLTGEALGLLYLGTLLPELPDAPRWRRRGWRVLVDQVDRHALPDGTYFERATYYHRYTVDIYTHALLLGRAGAAPEEDLQRVEAALERLLRHLLFLTRPDGASPLIGDDDGGHLWFPEPGRLDDFRPSLSNGAAVFARPDMAHVAGGAHEETLWLLGPEALDGLDALPHRPPATLAAAFPDGGYYVMRDGWSPGASHMVVDVGPHGILNAGHAHADALSFELTVRGRPALVDPGTYSYADAAERDRFRSGAAHNTVTVSGTGSSVPGSAFQWAHATDARCRRWLSAPRFDVLSGTHSGFDRVGPPGEHRRDLLHARGAWWALRDRVAVDAHAGAEIGFQAAPGLDVVPAADGARITARAGEDVVQVYSWDPEGRPLPGRVEHGWVSRAYGRRAPAPRWVVACRDVPAEALTLLLPGERVAVEASREPAGLTLRFDHEGARHTVLAGGGAPRRSGRWHTDAEWLWAREGDAGETDVVVVAASRLELDGRPLLAEAERVEWFEARTGADREDWEPGRAARSPGGGLPSGSRS